MNTYIIDTECYKNYWLFLAVNHKTGASLESTATNTEITIMTDWKDNHYH
jgi:hypothetical protein